MDLQVCYNQTIDDGENGVDNFIVGNTLQWSIERQGVWMLCMKL
jgi:hypothetical protein